MKRDSIHFYAFYSKKEFFTPAIGFARHKVSSYKIHITVFLFNIVIGINLFNRNH